MSKPTKENFKDLLQACVPEYNALKGAVLNRRTAADNSWGKNPETDVFASSNAEKSSMRRDLIHNSADAISPSLVAAFTECRDLFTVVPKTKTAHLDLTHINTYLDEQIRGRHSFIQDLVYRMIYDGVGIIRTTWDKREKEVTLAKDHFMYKLTSKAEHVSRIKELAHKIALQDEDLIYSYSEEEIKAAEKTFKWYEDRADRIAESVLESAVSSLDGPSQADSVQAQQAMNFNDPSTWGNQVYYPYYSHTSYGDDPGLKTKKKVNKVVANQPKIEVVDPLTILVPPFRGKSLQEASYVISVSCTTIGDLIASPLYKDKAHLRQMLSYEVPDQEIPTVGSFKEYFGINNNQQYLMPDPSQRKVILYSFCGLWDLHDTGRPVPIILEYCNGEIIRLVETNMDAGYKMFHSAQYCHNPDIWYSTRSLPEDLEGIQKALTQLMRNMSRTSGISSSRSILYESTLFGQSPGSNQEKQNFMEGKPSAVQPSGAKPLQERILPITYQDITQETFVYARQLEGLAEGISGAKAYSSGINGTELGEGQLQMQELMSAMSSRRKMTIRSISELLASVGLSVLLMAQRFLNGSDSFYVKTKQSPSPVLIHPTYLRGDYTISVAVEPWESSQVRMHQIGTILQTDQTLPPYLKRLLIARMAEAADMPDVAAFLENYRPEEDPEYRRQLEANEQMMQLAQQEGQVTLSKIAAEAKLKEADAAFKHLMAEALKVKTPEEVRKLMAETYKLTKETGMNERVVERQMQGSLKLEQMKTQAPNLPGASGADVPPSPMEQAALQRANTRGIV